MTGEWFLKTRLKYMSYGTLRSIITLVTRAGDTMIVVSDIKAVTSEEMILDNSYILLSAAEEQLYITSDSDKKFIKLFGRPAHYGLFSCCIDEDVELDIKNATTFCQGECPGLYKHVKEHGITGDLAIIWD